MNIPIYGYKQLKQSLKILKSTAEFDSSKQGFLINVCNSFNSGLITLKEKEELLNTI